MGREEGIVGGRLDKPPMSILNVLLTRDHLVVAVDTLAEDAHTGAHSAGAKLLLIPQHNLVLATRGSTQFFLRIYELALQASFRADFTMEQLSAELGLVVDQIWPNYEKAAAEVGLPLDKLGTELVLGGWSPKNGRMMATGYAKSDSQRPCVVQVIGGPAGIARRAAAGCHAEHGPGRSDGSCAPAGQLPE